VHPHIHAARNPDKPAYVMAGSGETVTYGQLEERSNRIAQMFRAQGLKVGDHIAIFLENHPRFFEICWAAQRSGLVHRGQLPPDGGRGRLHHGRLRGDAVHHLALP
jgi:long-chain acyl-CoA synthetase